MKVTLDRREGANNLDQRYKVTDVTEAANIVSMLDGVVHTLAYFERADGTSLMVGGGKTQFIVTFTCDGQDLTLANDTVADDNLIEVCAGGQFGEYPSEIVCNIDQVKKAVIRFFDGSEAGLNWI